MPAATGYCARRPTRCGASRPITSTSIRYIGLTRSFRSKRRPKRCRRSSSKGRSGLLGVSNFSVAQIERFRRVAKLHVVQPPYNLFERAIEDELLPYCRRSGLATLTYGALCRGLLSGKLQETTQFDGDDLRLIDPKFRPPRFAEYLAAVRRLDQFARSRYGKRVIHLAGRWLLDQGATTALWGARHPGQLQPIDEVLGWSLDAASGTEIDRILRESITDPVGPEFMAPPARSDAEVFAAAQ
jgi:aryl-alcohol dehydrogenase-like predicted oxidoreductase